MHLVEGFEESRLEVEPLACVRRSACGIRYADDAGIVSKSTEDLAKMIVILTAFESVGLHRTRNENGDVDRSLKVYM